MTAPDIIAQLVERFDRNRDGYRSDRYNETQLRREFLDPFFDALGYKLSVLTSDEIALVESKNHPMEACDE
jgi:hypothetical protein